MNISEFAEKHRLKTKRDDCGELIIPGKDGYIFEYNDFWMGVALVDSTPKKWGNRRRGGEAVGMTVYADGHDEGVMLFKPTSGQATYAIKVARCRQKRRLTEEQREALVARLEKARRKQAVQSVESI